MNILYLTLKLEFFVQVLNREKIEEYRDDTDYWKVRLEGKEKLYTHVLFRNGYSKNAPEILIECKGIQLEYWIYENGDDDYIWVIKLGKIVKTRNIDGLPKTVTKTVIEKPAKRYLFSEVKDKKYEELI